jgi:hypothetical protein
MREYKFDPSKLNFKSTLPKVNLRKIKLGNIKKLNKSSLDLLLIKLEFPEGLSLGKKDSVVVSSLIDSRELILKPLKRKEEKKIELEKVKVKVKVKVKEVEVKKEKKEDEPDLVWPPKTNKLQKKNKMKSKKNTYFISNSSEDELESSKQVVQEEKSTSSKNEFPWALNEQHYESLDTIFTGGLENELIDLEDKDNITLPFEEKPVIVVEKKPEEPKSAYIRAFKPDF